MENINNNFKVFDKWKKRVGLLSYNEEKDTYFFRYSPVCKGFPYSDIDTNKDREFEQQNLFNIFALDDSYSKNRIIENHNLHGKTDNEIQLFILNLFSQKQELSPKGFYYEKI